MCTAPTPDFPICSRLAPGSVAIAMAIPSSPLLPRAMRSAWHALSSSTTTLLKPRG